MPPKPASKWLRGERRNASFQRNARHHLGNVAQERQLSSEIGQPGSKGGQPCPQINIPKRVSTERTRSPLVVMREKLCLISCYIDADRAIALASFASQAEVQSGLDVLILPASSDHLGF